MKLFRNICYLLLLLFITPFAQSSSSVFDVIQNINRSSIMNYIRHLQSYNTRFMLAPNRFEIANWIKGEFESMGFEDVKLDSFYNHANIRLPLESLTTDTTTLQVNVVATLPGYETPDDIYIIGGHYDSFCDNADIWVTAPGADDNASGTTCVLESARAVMAAGYQPKSTLVFIAFAAEELGNFSDMMGSEHYANEAAERGDNIRLVINNDMISYNVHHITEATVNVGPTENFTRINQVLEICNTYGNINYIGEGYSGADLRGFSSRGYDGIYFEENDFMSQFYTNYHKNTDVWNNIDSLFVTEVIKAAAAVLLSFEDVLSSSEADQEMPAGFTIYQNYPNPFNPSTAIEYYLPQSEHITIKVFNALGELTATLADEVKPPGKHRTLFKGDKLPGGVYFYSFVAGNYRQTNKMVLLK